VVWILPLYGPEPLFKASHIAIVAPVFHVEPLGVDKRTIHLLFTQLYAILYHSQSNGYYIV
jgi:hypothetical protein